VDPGVHVLQIDLTLTDNSTSPKLVHAFLISLILNDSKTNRHNNTSMTQHTSPVRYFHTYAIQKGIISRILFTEYIHSRRYKRFFQQIHKREV
jgi:site-specific recombinase XerD